MTTVHRSGVVVLSDEHPEHSFVFMHEIARCQAMGDAGRALAESTFDVWQVVVTQA